MESTYEKGCGDCPHGNDVHCIEIGNSIHCTHCCDEDLCTQADPQMLSSSLGLKLGVLASLVFIILI